MDASAGSALCSTSVSPPRGLRDPPPPVQQRRRRRLQQLLPHPSYSSSRGVASHELLAAASVSCSKAAAGLGVVVVGVVVGCGVSLNAPPQALSPGSTLPPLCGDHDWPVPVRGNQSAAAQANNFSNRCSPLVGPGRRGRRRLEKYRGGAGVAGVGRVRCRSKLENNQIKVQISERYKTFCRRPKTAEHISFFLSFLVITTATYFACYWLLFWFLRELLETSF